MRYLQCKQIQRKHYFVAKRLYDIDKTAGGFEVTLPGLIDGQRERIVGTTTENCKTGEEAARIVAEKREAVRILFEKISLEKTYAKFWKIEAREGGEFHVTIPALYPTKSGYSISGGAGFIFADWDAAKNFYLAKRQEQEKLDYAPLFEIEVEGDSRIVFSDFNTYNPKVAPTDEVYEVPASIQRYVFSREDTAELCEKSTYQRTVEEKDWQNKLYDFLTRYLEEQGMDLKKRLGIKNLKSLSPKQAADLTVQVVLALTKYKYSDTQLQRVNDKVPMGKTRADQSTALQLLHEGLINNNDPQWEGNGVCRNFAMMVKLIFEALKLNQTQYSQLQNMYCLYEGGKEYAPKKEEKNNSKIDPQISHAWNSFVTIAHTGEASTVMVDVTWAKQDLETGKAEDVDYTLVRMEPIIDAIGQDLHDADGTRQEKLLQILSYYDKAAQADNNTTGGHSTIEEQKQFNATKAFAIIMRYGVPAGLPDSLIQLFGEQYQTMKEVDAVEIENLWKISRSYPQLDAVAILKAYLHNPARILSDYHVKEFLFQDNELQRRVVDEIKSHKDFNTLVKNAPEFRVRIREVYPQLLGEFSPLKNPADALELKYFLRRSRLLRDYENYIDPQQPSERKIQDLLEKARKKLTELNKIKSTALIASLSDYDLLKRYDSLYAELKIRDL